MAKKMRHTAGPWEYRKRETTRNPSGHEVRSFMGMLAATYHSNTVDGKANADRIVSCVNGCDAAGVLEPGALKDLVECVKRGLDSMDDDFDLYADTVAALRAVRGE